jgi:hypothetical protein
MRRAGLGSRNGTQVQRADTPTNRRQRVKKDPFLAIYRDVANDLLAVFQGLSRNERLAIRDVAKLRFARTFAPAAFEELLARERLRPHTRRSLAGRK